MTLIRTEEPIPRERVEKLLTAAAPERLADLDDLWCQYDPRFHRAPDAAGITMQANRERVLFDNKTLSVYWLLAFTGWRTLNCYCPAVLASLAPSILARAFGVGDEVIAAHVPPTMTIADALEHDTEVAHVETYLDEKLYSARSILRSDVLDETFWPSDIPWPDVDRESLLGAEAKAAFDLAWMSTAYAFCHEIRHVIYAKEKNAPTRPQEEAECDRYAREFLTARVSDYAAQTGTDHDKVLAKRSMAGAVSIFVLYETTARSSDAGDADYPPIADRMDITLRDTALPEDDNFWVFYASVLVAILRRRNRSPAIRAASPRQLCTLLVEEIRRTS
jgi:hypothetical protein